MGLVLRVLFEGYFRGSLADVARRAGLGLKCHGWQPEIVLGAGKFTPCEKLETRLSWRQRVAPRAEGCGRFLDPHWAFGGL